MKPLSRGRRAYETSAVAQPDYGVLMVHHVQHRVQPAVLVITQRDIELGSAVLFQQLVVGDLFRR